MIIQIIKVQLFELFFDIDGYYVNKKFIFNYKYLIFKIIMFHVYYYISIISLIHL